MMQVQISRLPGLGDFQTLPGNFYAQSQLKAEPLMNLPPEVWGQATPLPGTAPAPSAPGAILPTQAPTYLFPTTTEQPAAAAPEKKDLDTKTVLIAGGIVLAGIAAMVLLGN